MDNLFLKIISGDIPSECVYEDSETYAFLDINPNSKGHTLVVPKVYTRNLLTMSEKDFGRLMETVHKVALAVTEATDADGVNVIMNNEPAAGQIVFHAHVHVIPRFEGDHVFEHAHHTTYSEGEMRAYAEKIKRSVTMLLS